MRIDPIVPDLAVRTAPAQSGVSAGFGELVRVATAQLDRADAAESAFAHGSGGLQEMVVARARADITLSVAATGAGRAAQALNTLLGMQI